MKRFALILVSLAIGMTAWAQTTVRGTVQDSSGQPIVGAGILQAGSSTNGVVSELDGSFVIKVPADATLDVSCVGYASQSVPVNNRTNITIILEEDAELLDDVVVVAFGKMKKEGLIDFKGPRFTILDKK